MLLLFEVLKGSNLINTPCESHGGALAVVLKVVARVHVQLGVHALASQQVVLAFHAVVYRCHDSCFGVVLAVAKAEIDMRRP